MSSRQGWGGPKEDLLNRPYLIKTQRRGGGPGQKFLILRRGSLWTAPKIDFQSNLRTALQSILHHDFNMETDESLFKNSKSLE